ncbi:MAG: ATP-binding cassette domain-containing protein [Verrucomicrobiota bacterium]|nr:ATP-binding cassette domain-containing protein [Verrucomicrobiota bacterium]
MKSLQIENLALSAGNFKLKNISFHIEQDEYFVLKGLTGSGKSLIMKAICGLIRLDSGKILIDGKDVTNLQPRFRKVGYIPQNSLLFPHLNVEENIAFGLKFKDFSKNKITEEVDKITELVGISQLLNRNVLNLSGGEKQKVNICRALILKPKILLLDEPLSAVDEGHRDKLCSILKSLQKKTKIPAMHISHNKKETELIADRISILENGKIKGVL